MSKSVLLAALVAGLNLIVAPAGALAAGDWAWPVRGEVITQYRNGDDAYAAGQHRGIDIGARVGDPVSAAAGGQVTFAGVAGSSGLTVAVRTADGRFDTSYLHLASASVREGDAVATGERIGSVGTSGRRSAEAPHLHFGVREAGSRHAYRDPLTLLGPPPRERPEPGPRPVPVPLAVPQPAAPAAAPARAAAPASVPLPGLVVLPAAAALGPAPGARPHSASPRVPGHVGRHGAPVRTAVPGLAALGAPAPAHRFGRAAASAGPKQGAARPPTPAFEGSGPAPAQPRLHARLRTGPAHAPGRHGIDLGWLVACAGLVGAAAALGRAGKRGAVSPRLAVGIARLRGSHGR